MGRQTVLALLISIAVAVAIIVGGLVPRDAVQGPVRHDGAIVHGLAFLLLVLPLVRVWPGRWIAIVVLAAVFGGAIEVLQTLVERAPEWSDVLANVLGALLGATMGRFLSWRAGRRS